MDEFLTTGQAARIVGATRVTIARACKLGHLTGVKVGRDWLIKRSDLEKWLAAGGYKPDRIRKDRRKPGG